jgi:hypothetical protein
MRTRTAAAWVAIVLGVVLVLSAALGFGEARLLAQRGVEMTTVQASDGSRWVLAGGDRLVPARSGSDTVIADPSNPDLNAASALHHARSAGVALLTGLLVASAGAALGRGTRSRPATACEHAPAARHLRLVASA